MIIVSCMDNVFEIRCHMVSADFQYPVHHSVLSNLCMEIYASSGMSSVYHFICTFGSAIRISRSYLSRHMLCMLGTQSLNLKIHCQITTGFFICQSNLYCCCTVFTIDFYFSGVYVRNNQNERSVYNKMRSR